MLSDCGFGSHRQNAFVIPAKHDAHHMGGIARTDFSHEARAMRLDRSHTDGEAATSLLIRGAGDNLRQHLAFAPRQQLVAGEIKLHADRFVTIAPTICEGCNGTPNASDYEMGIERL